VLGVSHQGDAHEVMRRAISHDGAVSNSPTTQPPSNDHAETEDVVMEEKSQQEQKNVCGLKCLTFGGQGTKKMVVGCDPDRQAVMYTFSSVSKSRFALPKHPKRVGAHRESAVMGIISLEAFMRKV